MNVKEIFKIASVPVVLASLCCLSPVILVLLGVGTVGFASSLADNLYGTYKWYFRLAGLAALSVSLFFYLRRAKGICTIDEAARRRNEIINIAMASLIAAVVGYIFFLYVVVHYAGVGLDIWRDYGADERNVVAQAQAIHTSSSSTRQALFANGCFWCVEADLEKVDGVLSVSSGYAGGTTDNPTYSDYATGGHREVVEVVYDASRVSFQNLVEHILKHGDPTDASGSFFDRGFSYSPAIYYSNPSEMADAKGVVQKVSASNAFNVPVSVAVVPSVRFWPAEEYHQDYYKKNPLKYSYYRAGSGRDDYIQKYWGERREAFEYSVGPSTVEASMAGTSATMKFSRAALTAFVKPSDSIVRNMLTPLQYEVTQKDGTETPFANVYDKNEAAGIYVDLLSGEPLYSSRDKYDSGTGWPSFVKPITPEAVTLHVESGIFNDRTEVRSRFADSHLGHVFDDGPADRGGKRYCMNSSALRFVPLGEMEAQGYGEYLVYVR